MKKAKLLGLLIASLLLSTSAWPLSKQPKLRPSPKYWDYVDPHPIVHISRLSRNRRLASVGDTLYMLNGRNRITWTWTSNGPPLTDIPIVDSTGTIYVLGYDLLWAAIESETGREKWRGIANGRALYSQLELFQGDTYLVVTDMSAYRESLHEFIKDKLTLCRGNAVLWDTEIPAGARIRVSGKRVFMIYRHKKHLVRVPFSVPPHLSKPLGKISVLADYD